MSPGGLNSVGCAESGAEGWVLAGSLGFPDRVVDALDVGEPAAVGDGPLEELHPASAAADKAITLAMVTAVAMSADRGVVMHSTLRAGFPADGQWKVSDR
jgi:hypothetical protein